MLWDVWETVSHWVNILNSYKHPLEDIWWHVPCVAWRSEVSVVLQAPASLGHMRTSMAGEQSSTDIT